MSTRAVRMISWNIGHLPLWTEIASQDIDVALLQEVPSGAPASMQLVPDATTTWSTHGWEKRPWRTAIARVSDDVVLAPITTDEFSDPDWSSLRISRPGSITAARVHVNDQEAFVAVAVYAPWERPLGRDQPAWADASAHRILSDLTPLLWDQRRHPLVIAGDWNILFGYGEHGDASYAARYQSVFDRASALGLRFIGPQYPNGRQAQPWPAELPEDSGCVPTFHHSQQTPATATRQLDFVLASGDDR